MVGSATIEAPPGIDLGEVAARQDDWRAGAAVPDPSGQHLPEAVHPVPSTVALGLGLRRGQSGNDRVGGEASDSSVALLLPAEWPASGGGGPPFGTPPEHAARRLPVG